MLTCSTQCSFPFTHSLNYFDGALVVKGSGDLWNVHPCEFFIIITFTSLALEGI